MNKIVLKAEKRKLTGRKVKRLRKEGILPTNIYGKKVKSEEIQVDLKEFQKVFKDIGATTLLELDLGTEKRPVLIHNLQRDPVTNIPLHVDFLQVDLSQKVTAEVSVELVGESSAEKQGIGTVVLYINKIEVEALPENLPNKFEIDISKLIEVGMMVQVKDLPIDKKKVEVKADLEQILVKVEPPKKEEEIVAPPTTEEVPVEGAPSETPAGEVVEGAEPSQEKKEGE